MQALAVTYRPKTFDDVVGQDNIKIILKQQLETNEFKHAYLFCGGAGTGKTTCARIFANELNKGLGTPIELDAASNNGVDDVKNIAQKAKSKSMDSEFKVFIIDECHSISNAGWQAFLKIIEEPPAKSIFIFCTTDPQKIPKTILSRVQRYDFQRISMKGITERLQYILETEGYHTQRTISDKRYNEEAVEYIAKIADGGMRDAITLMDKCLAYSSDLTLDNVINALGTVDYSKMIDLTDSLVDENHKNVISIIEDIHNSGKDIKTFLKQYMQFLLDINKYGVGCPWTYISIPKIDSYINWLDAKDSDFYDIVWELLEVIVKLNADIKYSQTAKYDIEAVLMLFGGESE